MATEALRAQRIGDADPALGGRVGGDIPAWAGSETLYSWCVGFHKVYGSDSAKATGVKLFGRSHACRVHDLPCGLAFLEQHTGGALGSLKEILLTRTVLAAYAPLMDEDKYMRLAESLIAGNASGSKATWGMAASRLGARHPLRYCPKCAAIDDSTYGRRLWHLEHQFPATHVCVEHRVSLSSPTTGRSLWLEPPPVVESPPNVDLSCPPMHVAMIVKGIAACRRVQWERVAEAIVISATENGFDVGTPNRLRSHGFQAMLAGSRVWDWFLSTASSSVLLERPDWAIETLRDRRMRHPSRVAVLWAAAHESTLCSRRSADRFLAMASSSPPRIQTSLWPDSDASRSNQLPSNVIAAVNTGDDLGVIATAIGVSPATLRRWLRDQETLGAQWRAARFERRLKSAVAAIEGHLELNVSVTRSALLRTLNTDCEWLRRNAPVELRSLLDSVPTKRHPQMGLDF